MDDKTPHDPDAPACDACAEDITVAQCNGSQRRTGGIWCKACEPTVDDLTPYDTGERATPIPWVSEAGAFTAMLNDRDPDEFGRVDFEDDERRTIATVYMARRDDGGYTLHVGSLDDDLTIEES